MNSCMSLVTREGTTHFMVLYNILYIYIIILYIYWYMYCILYIHIKYINMWYVILWLILCMYIIVYIIYSVMHCFQYVFQTLAKSRRSHQNSCPNLRTFRVRFNMFQPVTVPCWAQPASSLSNVSCKLDLDNLRTCKLPGRIFDKFSVTKWKGTQPKTTWLFWTCPLYPTTK